VLAIYPVVQDELFENITSEITGEITYDKLKKLNFLDAIIKETQRVYPTAPMLSRECDETTTINGFPIEKVVYFFEGLLTRVLVTKELFTEMARFVISFDQKVLISLIRITDSRRTDPKYSLKACSQLTTNI
jgi:hypothetical protein